MQSNVGNISRSSSIALSNANRKTTFDDLKIAQELLSLQNLLPSQLIPRRKSSVFGTSPGHLSLDGIDSTQQNESVPAASSLRPSSRRAICTSNTWTSSDGEYVAEQDEVDDRKIFVEQYNILARKHGVRKMAESGSEGFNDEFGDSASKRDNWFSRKILRKTSSSYSVKAKPDRSLRHKRSISDLSLRLKMKKDKLKDKDLQELVILCGSSRLYLPAEYSASTLCVPTCFRATAQYLVQYGTTTRGLFRIPGSQTTVAALYNHFCSMDEYGDVVAGTVRCPILPDHIRCDVHDVASAFKKFLSGLPGGILGSLALFDAFISIQTQLHGDPELTRTKQSKVRARLIALAISTSRSLYRRDLICAVFGLLCMLGRASETARREDDRGHPLPTSNLMGYGPLGIVFGPLLVGDLLEDYTMRLADPHGGLVLLPISPPKSKKERRKKVPKSGDEGSAFNTHVDKLKVANGITEMLITHWRDVVRHMKHMDSIKRMASLQSFEIRSAKSQTFLRPSASASFAIRKPPDWDLVKLDHRSMNRSVSPTPLRRPGAPMEEQNGGNLSVRKQRLKPRPKSFQQLSGARSLSILSPTLEEASKSAELSSNAGSSFRGMTYSSTPRKLAPDIATNFQISSITANQNTEHLPEAVQPSRPVMRRKPSAKILQHVNAIEARLSPNKDSPRPTPKKLVKSQVAKDFPSRVTWAVGDDANSKAVTRSSRTSPSKLHESLSISRLPIRRKMVPGQPNIVYSIPNSKGQSQKDQASSMTVLEKQWPEIRLLKATSRDNNESGDFRVQRRLVESEPTPQVITPGRPPRRVSRSLDADPKGKGQLIDSSKLLKDPLARVSQEEDNASLKTLAEALNAEKCKDEELVESIYLQPTRNPPLIRGDAAKPTGPLPSTSQNSITIDITTNVPQRTDSASSRISMLVAKFNHEDSTPHSISRRPSSPLRSPRKLVEEDYPYNPSTPKDSKERLLARYTMNSSTPTKLQKSVISDKPPKPIRSPVFPLTRPISTIQKATTLPSTPRQLLQGSFHDSTPLRSVLKSLEKTSSLPKPSNSFSVSLRPVQKSITQPATTPTKETARKSWRPFFDGNFSTPTGSTSTQASARPCGGINANEHSSQRAKHFGSPNHQRMAMRSVHVPSAVAPNSATSVLDSPCSHANFGKFLPGHEPAPVAQHVHFARPKSSFHEVDDLHPESSFPDAFASSNTFSRVCTPGPGRSNSVLYNQVRNLQRQLATKTEEVQQLRQQLDAKESLDIGILSEQLREAKREIGIWKARAETSEKRLKSFDRTHCRTHSSLRGLSMLSAERPKSLGADHSANMVTSSEINKRVFHGLDGARSTAGWNSEETCDTVIREIRENAITGSEYSIWVEQMNAREFMAPDD